MHIELHTCLTSKDAARLGHAGLPRYDIETGTVCGTCNRRVGEVQNSTGESVAWKPLTVVVWESGIGVLCAACTKSVDKLVSNR